MTSLGRLAVKIFADGADLPTILKLHAKPYIKGLTTNPSLMRKAGVADYRAFALEVLRHVTDKPVSFEVLADDFATMERQALDIAGWAENVYVKIPVMNTHRESASDLIEHLSARQVKLNITAITTLEQIRQVMSALNPDVPSFISVFAGRVADTGRDPLPLIAQAVQLLRSSPRVELIWASARELLNIFQADSVGCSVITVTPDILGKLPLIDYDLTEYSLDTVRMFYDDARSAGFSL